jgi:hypothetical protein
MIALYLGPFFFVGPGGLTVFEEIILKQRRVRRMQTTTCLSESPWRDALEVDRHFAARTEIAGLCWRGRRGTKLACESCSIVGTMPL